MESDANRTRGETGRERNEGFARPFFLTSRLTTRRINGELPEALRAVVDEGEGGRGGAGGVGVRTEVVYTEGSDALRAARLDIAAFSLPRARERVAAQRRLMEERAAYDVRMAERGGGGEAMEVDGEAKETDPLAPPPLRDDEVAENAFLKSIVDVHASLSQVGDRRPLAHCALSPDGSTICTAAWGGVISLWDVETAEKKRELLGHEDRIASVAFHPESTRSLAASGPNIVSAGTDHTVRLWALDAPAPLATLAGHQHRVMSAAFHPSGRYIGSASWDMTWRLWDVETQTSLVEQDGHAQPLTSVAFQGDGSLAVTTSLDASALLWDLRRGRAIMTLSGHLKGVLCADFHPDGHHVATGSADNTIRIWDLRKRETQQTIPAHAKIVRAVRYQPGNGLILASASYDRTCRLWNAARDYAPLATLAGHEHNVMGVDVSADGRTYVSAAYDRTFKIWRPAEVQ